MKTKRSLSGIYFRFQDEETGKWGNRVFEDLPEEKQDKCMDGYNEMQLKSFVKKLANTLNDIGEQFDLDTE